MRRIKVLCILVFSLAAVAQVREKPACKVSRLNPLEVAISCLNGADPTGYKAGNSLIISCGQEK